MKVAKARLRSFGAACALVCGLAGAPAASAPSPATPPVALGRAECAETPARSLPPRAFSFPRDHGAHDAFENETWRAFGRVRDVAGNPYDLSVTISRYALESCGVRMHGTLWKAARIVTSAYTLLDERTGATSRGERVEREGPLGAFAATGRLLLSTADLRVAEASHDGADPVFTMRLRAGDRAALELVTRARGAPHPLGPQNIVKTGSCETCTAYAYAYTRGAASGTLSLGAAAHAVGGRLWIDHEFGHTELDERDAGWDRFDIAFADGSALDARFTRGFDDRILAVSGVRVDARGRTRFLDSGSDSERVFPPNATWHSEVSGVTYPASWELDEFGVQPFARNQEIFERGRAPFATGPIDALRSSDGGGGAGHGFVELSGYAPGSP